MFNVTKLSNVLLNHMNYLNVKKPKWKYSVRVFSDIRTNTFVRRFSYCKSGIEFII